MGSPSSRRLLASGFDPNMHHAWYVYGGASDVPPGSVLTIAEVVQKGYIVDGRLIRDARVIVERKPAG